ARMRNADEAASAYRAAVKMHPACTTLQAAARFLTAEAHYREANAVREQLHGCAPASLAYAQGLAEAGRHRDAAAAAREVVIAEPFDRNARALLVNELMLAGQRDEAAIAARDLHSLAPNSAAYKELA